MGSFQFYSQKLNWPEADTKRIFLKPSLHFSFVISNTTDWFSSSSVHGLPLLHLLLSITALEPTLPPSDDTIQTSSFAPHQLWTYFALSAFCLSSILATDYYNSVRHFNHQYCVTWGILHPICFLWSIKQTWNTMFSLLLMHQMHRPWKRHWHHQRNVFLVLHLFILMFSTLTVLCQANRFKAQCTPFSDPLLPV